MARKVHSIEIDCDGDKRTFFYRLPSGRMMLRQSDLFKKDQLTNEQSGHDLLMECIVQEDGTPVGKKGVDEILDEGWDVLQQLNAVLTPAKRDAEKNA